MNIAIIGAGAIGIAVAVETACAGRNVTLIARGERLEQLRRHALRLASDDALKEVRVPTLSAAEIVKPVDLAIICVKTCDLAEALASINGKLSANAVILTLQNGVEAHEEAANRYPGCNIVAGRMHGFFELEGNTAHHMGVPPSIVFGCTRGDARNAHHRVAQAFRGCGITTEMSPEIQRKLWEKFMLAASLGSVAVALGMPAGKVCLTSEGAALLKAAMTEVAVVARAAGIDLAEAEVDAALDFARSFPAHATTSLQRDLELGRKSEYHALTEAVPRIARRHGVALDIFPALAAQISMRGLIANAQ